MEFRNWLSLRESTTISDSLKNQDRELLRQYKTAIRDFLQSQVPAKSLETATNFFTYLYISENLPPAQVPTQLNQDWQKYGAYVTGRIGQRTPFLMMFTRQELNTANTVYHRDLKLGGRNRRKGPEGSVVVEVDKTLAEAELPSVAGNYQPSVWAGWRWVSLGCGQSKIEGAAGGHCGNEGSKRGDNILSLRDSKNKVHLTFIVNTTTGNLGEAKGVDNEKPDKNYHPAIVALLLSGYVKHYQGGGYKPENNFHPDDLLEPIKSFVLDHLAGVSNHAVPDNYYPTTWVSQWSQAAVDAMPVKDKIELLNSVFNVVKNHRPFDTHEYDDAGVEIDLGANVPKLHFDLQKLILEVIPQITNIKQLIDLLRRLYDLTGKNVLWGDENVKKYRPDLVDAQGELTVGGGDAKMDDSWHVSEDTIHAVSQRAMAVEGKSLRDKVELTDELSEIGEREEEDPTKQGLEKYKYWNIYDTEIAKLDREILQEAIQKGIPKSLTYEVQNVLHRMTKKNPVFEWLQMYSMTVTKDGKKTYHEFYANTISANWRSAFPESDRWGQRQKVSEPIKNSPYYQMGKETARRLEKEALPPLIPFLIKNGFSKFLGSNRLVKAAGNVVVEELLEQTKQRLRQRHKSAKIKGGTDFEIGFFRDAKEHMREVLATGQDDELFEYAHSITEEFARSWDATIKKLPQIVKQHHKRIIDESNNPKSYSTKAKRNVPVPRDVQRRHHARQYESFHEWLDQFDK